MTSTELYNDPASRFEEMKSSTDLLVKEIVWTKGNYFNVEPYEFERAGFKKGKILKSTPEDTNHKLCYLFDEEEKIICIKEGNNIPDNFTYTFYRYFESFIHSFHFHNSGMIINAQVVSLVHNMVGKMERCARQGSRIEIYHYEGTVLTQIDVSQKSGDVEQDFEVLFFYNSDGSLKQIKNIHPNGYEEVVYK